MIVFRYSFVCLCSFGWFVLPMKQHDYLMEAKTHTHTSLVFHWHIQRHSLSLLYIPTPFPKKSFFLLLSGIYRILHLPVLNIRASIAPVCLLLFMQPNRNWTQTHTLSLSFQHRPHLLHDRYIEHRNLFLFFLSLTHIRSFSCNEKPTVSFFCVWFILNHRRYVDEGKLRSAREMIFH